MEQRSQIAMKYDKAIHDLSYIRAPIIPADCRHGYQAYVTLFQPEIPTLKNVVHLNSQRNILMDELEAAGIATRPGTHAVHMLGYYREKYNIKSEEFPNAYFADQLSMAIPLFVQLTDAEQQYVVECLKAFKI